ncbi:MAG: hypothetical protein J4G06_01520 [Caldilineaceae bacterium]|nr:hypothetical protein [Caldilineaceae bacterium]
MSKPDVDAPDDIGPALKTYILNIVDVWVARSGTLWHMPHPQRTLNRLRASEGVKGSTILPALIEHLGRNYAARPVVLVDEYDASVTRFMGTTHNPAGAAEGLWQIRDRPYGREHIGGARATTIGLAFRHDPQLGAWEECEYTDLAPLLAEWEAESETKKKKLMPKD